MNKKIVSLNPEVGTDYYQVRLLKYIKQSDGCYKRYFGTLNWTEFQPTEIIKNAGRISREALKSPEGVSH